LLTRPALLLLTVSALAFALVLSVLRAVSPSPAPVLDVPRVVEPALTRHLLFVVVDGLRYDIATDPKRMPHFARAMRRQTSGEVWASRVSMTTSAVLAYGTGQRGALEQVLRNVNAKPPPFDNWLSHARAAGLSVMAVGEPAWTQMYGAELVESRVDPEGVAIDVDFNPQTFSAARELLARQPNFLVLHFVTPDHQGHAYGIFSERYARHIRDFDDQLYGMLQSLSPDWTVVVTSDHGAADTGTHGTDVDIQRRSPIYAYGPGIASGVHPQERLDQTDVGGTLAALLGVAAPAHSRGHLLSDWLDLPAGRRANLACADGERTLAYGRAARADLDRAEKAFAACENSSLEPSVRTAAARETARAVDRVMATTKGPVLRAAPTALIVFLLATAAVLIALGRRALEALPAVGFVAAAAAGLVFAVERLPGSLPNVARVLLFTLGNLGVLFVLLAPARAAGWLERRPLLAPVLVPGLLLATYTSNTQAQSYALMGSIALFLTYVGVLSASARSPLSQRPRSVLGRLELFLLVALIALLALPGTKDGDIYPRWLLTHSTLQLGIVLLALGAWAAAHRESASERKFWVLGFCVCALSLVVRPAATPWLGRGAIIACGLLAAAAALSGRRALALVFGVASFVWVARLRETLALLATLAVAELVGAVLTRRRASSDADGARESSFASILLLTAFVFSLLYVQRIGIQGALDFTALDWGAAGFGDPHVGAWVVGAALVYKYVLAELLVLGALGSLLAFGTRERLFRAVAVAYVARSGMLFVMFLVCSESFWTTLRVAGDLPFALTGALASAIAWAGVCRIMYVRAAHRHLAPVSTA
jgi:hypothetical protein